MRKNKVMFVHSIACTNWSDEFWEFTLVSGERWDYDRMRHVVMCRGETVAEMVMCLGDAVIFARGFETGVMNMIVTARRWEADQRAKGMERPDLVAFVNMLAPRIT